MLHRFPITMPPQAAAQRVELVHPQGPIFRLRPTLPTADRLVAEILQNTVVAEVPLWFTGIPHSAVIPMRAIHLIINTLDVTTTLAQVPCL